MAGLQGRQKTAMWMPEQSDEGKILSTCARSTKQEKENLQRQT